MTNKTYPKPVMVRAIRKTGKKIHGYTVYESINPETRKLFGLPPIKTKKEKEQQHEE